MSRYRMPEQRARQAEQIHDWKLWEKATRPKTEAGKQRSAKRGYKGGLREQQRLISRILREQKETLKRIPT